MKICKPLRLVAAILLFGIQMQTVEASERDEQKKMLLRIVVFDVADDPVVGMPVEIVDISRLTTNFIKVVEVTNVDGSAVFSRADFREFRERNGKYKVRIIVGEESRLKEKREIALDPKKPVTIEVTMSYEGERLRGVAAIDKLFKRGRYREKTGY